MSIKNIVFKRNWVSFIISSVTLTALIFATIVSFEPGVAYAVNPSNIVVTLNVTAGITLTATSLTTTMSTPLGLTQFSAIGTSTLNVKTNNNAGYTLDVKATSSPAMASSTLATSSILDYQQGAPNTWAATSGAAYFGYSAFGADTSTGTWGTGTVCSGANSNSTSTTLKYKGFTTTTAQIIAQRAATTSVSGVDTTLCYAVDANAFFIPSGTYTATIIATAIAL